MTIEQIINGVSYRVQPQVDVRVGVFDIDSRKFERFRRTVVEVGNEVVNFAEVTAATVVVAALLGGCGRDAKAVNPTVEATRSPPTAATAEKDPGSSTPKVEKTPAPTATPSPEPEASPTAVATEVPAEVIYKPSGGEIVYANNEEKKESERQQTELAKLGGYLVYRGFLGGTEFTQVDAETYSYLNAEGETVYVTRASLEKTRGYTDGDGSVHVPYWENSENRTGVRMVVTRDSSGGLYSYLQVVDPESPNNDAVIIPSYGTGGSWLPGNMPEYVPGVDEALVLVPPGDSVYVGFQGGQFVGVGEDGSVLWVFSGETDATGAPIWDEAVKAPENAVEVSGTYVKGTLQESIDWFMNEGTVLDTRIGFRRGSDSKSSGFDVATYFAYTLGTRVVTTAEGDITTVIVAYENGKGNKVVRELPVVKTGGTAPRDGLLFRNVTSGQVDDYLNIKPLDPPPSDSDWITSADFDPTGLVGNYALYQVITRVPSGGCSYCTDHFTGLENMVMTEKGKATESMQEGGLIEEYDPLPMPVVKMIYSY